MHLIALIAFLLWCGLGAWILMKFDLSVWYGHFGDVTFAFVYLMVAVAIALWALFAWGVHAGWLL